MNDKNLMEDMLLLEKGMCDLLMHGAIESSTQNIHQTFSQALDNSICMQDKIYNTMSSKGWYSTEQVQQNKIDSVKQKFSSCCNCGCK